jgi:hypothetical protein
MCFVHLVLDLAATRSDCMHEFHRSLQLNFTRGRNWTLLTVHLAVSLLDRYLSATLRAPAPAAAPAQQPARTGKSGAPLRARAKKAPAPKPTGPRLSDAAHRTVLTATMLWVSKHPRMLILITDSNH